MHRNEQLLTDFYSAFSSPVGMDRQLAGVDRDLSALAPSSVR